jgi:Predicted periplasmic protein (DUF2092)
MALAFVHWQLRGRRARHWSLVAAVVAGFALLQPAAAQQTPQPPPAPPPQPRFALPALSATYFPFADVIVADPYGDLARGLQLAFVVGQSQVVGGTLTDIVAVANQTAQAQIWIGAEDKLPRRIQASFFDEFGLFRHVLELSDWQLDPAIPPGTFASAKAADAKRIPFAPPGTP